MFPLFADSARVPCGGERGRYTNCVLEPFLNDSALADARRRDAVDPLARFRDEFYVPPGRVYLDGNSLGLLSRAAEASVLRVLSEWKTQAIEGWTEADPPWFFLAEELSSSVAPLVGARPDEVIVSGSTTANLHQLLATLFSPRGTRTKILADALNFPSDLFAMESHLRLRGLDPATHLVKVASLNGHTLDENDIIAAMTPDVQLAVFPSVVYTSGQLLDMELVTRAARERAILIGWDCSHSIGAVPHALARWDADFAFWCHYKYLNAGPGAVGGLFVNRRHAHRAPGLAGWWGSRKDRQFDLTHTFAPAGGAGALQIGTPHVLSLAPLQGALALTRAAGIEAIRAKSLALTGFLMDLLETELAPLCPVIFANPRDDARRGGHVSLVHADAVRVCKALRRAGVVPDFRPPDIIRLAPVALYTSFEDCAVAVARLQTILATQSYEDQASKRGVVS